MTKYLLIERSAIETLEMAVERALELGWKCQGGVCVCRHITHTGVVFIRFYQAMIAEVKEQKNKRQAG